MCAKILTGKYVPCAQDKINLISMYNHANKSLNDIPTAVNGAHIKFLLAFADLATGCAENLNMIVQFVAVKETKVERFTTKNTKKHESR